VGASASPVGRPGNRKLPRREEKGQAGGQPGGQDVPPWECIAAVSTAVSALARTRARKSDRSASSAKLKAASLARALPRRSSRRRAKVEAVIWIASAARHACTVCVTWQLRVERVCAARIRSQTAA